MTQINDYTGHISRKFSVTKLDTGGIKMSRAGGLYRDRKRNQVCVCAFCKQVFYATRRDAKTCKPACRKALERLNKEPQMIMPEPREIPIKTRGSIVDKVSINQQSFAGRIFAKVVN